MTRKGYFTFLSSYCYYTFQLQYMKYNVLLRILSQLCIKKNTLRTGLNII